MKLNAILLLLLIVTAILSLGVGEVWMPLAQLLSAFAAHDSSPAALILYEIRLPRLLLGIMVGASLGISGAAIQGYVRNPLAEPGLFGVSSGAALGAVCALYSGLSAVFAYALPLLGMCGAMVAAALVYLLAGRQGGSYSLILAGIAVSSFAGAAVAVVLNLSPNPFAVMEIVFWLMGSLTDRSMAQFWLALPFMLLGGGMLLSTARGLEALSLGEDTARSLGVHLGWLEARLLIGTALMVGAAVAVAGTIGFVGLVVPHLLRPFVHYSPGKLLLPSAFAGAILLLLADMAVRLIPTSGTELKLGVVTALIGVPFFLLLLKRMQRVAI